MTMDHIGGLCFFVFAAAIGVQAWAAMRSQRAQINWPIVEAVVAQTEPVVDTSSEGTAYYLRLWVDVPEGRIETWNVYATSIDDLSRLAALHATGERVRLRRDPKSGIFFVDGHLPDNGAGWLIAVAMALTGIGIAAWFGLFRAFAPQAAG